MDDAEYVPVSFVRVPAGYSVDVNDDLSVSLKKGDEELKRSKPGIIHGNAVLRITVSGGPIVEVFVDDRCVIKYRSQWM